MERDSNTEDAVSKKRLRRKVLERWENEGGKICRDSKRTSRDKTLERDRGSSTQKQDK